MLFVFLQTCVKRCLLTLDHQYIGSNTDFSQGMCFPAIETSIKLLQGWKIASSSLSGWYVYKVGVASSHMNLVESLLSGWYGYKVGVSSRHMNPVGSLLSGWYGYKVGGIASSHMNLVGSLLSGWYGYKVGGIASSHMNLVGSLLSVLLPSIAGIRSSPVYQTDIHS